MIFSFYHNKSLHKLFGIVQVEVFSVKNSLKKNIKFRSYEFHTNDIEPVSTEKKKNDFEPSTIFCRTNVSTLIRQLENCWK